MFRERILHNNNFAYTVERDQDFPEGDPLGAELSIGYDFEVCDPRFQPFSVFRAAFGSFQTATLHRKFVTRKTAQGAAFQEIDQP